MSINAPLETGNDQLVGRRGDGTIIVTFPKSEMTVDEALRHAAWLVLIAGDEDRFAEVRAAILSDADI